jgi:hypothetical protein
MALDSIAMSLRISAATAMILIVATYVIGHPRWYMPSLSRAPQAESMSSEQLGASARRLKERLMTVAPEHFEMCVPNSVPDPSGSVMQLKQMLQAAGWVCDQCYSTSSAPLGFEIMAPADSESANIVYDWAQSVGQRPHFIIHEGKLTILVANRDE